MTSDICAHCGAVQPLASLLLVYERARPEIRWYVCRPGFEPHHMSIGSCFRHRVGLSSEHGIVPGDQDPPPAGYRPGAATSSVPPSSTARTRNGLGEVVR